MIEKKFPDLDAFISKFESKRKSIDRLRHRTRSFKSALSDEWIVVDKKSGKRKKIVFLSEDHLLLHVAKGFGSISIPTELSQGCPEVAKRVGELESVRGVRTWCSSARVGLWRSLEKAKSFD